MKECCSYDTVKYVHIEDARLGMLRVGFVVVIAAYVVAFEMLYMGGYLESSPVVGVVRFSLQQPTVNNCDPTADHSCYNAFVPLNELQYCRQQQQQQQQQLDDNSGSNNSSSSSSVSNYDDYDDYYYQGNVYPCEIYEAVNAQLVSEKSMTVITRGSTRNETLVCDSRTSMTCPRTYERTTTTTTTTDDKEDEEEYKFYTAQSEAFTVLVDHAVTAAKICTLTSDSSGSGSSRSRGRYSQSEDGSRSQHYNYACSAESSHYHGRLYTKNEDLCYEEHVKNNNSYAHYRGDKQTASGGSGGAAGFAPCYIRPNRTVTNQDFFSLDVLLRAAGITLDDCSDNNSSNSSNSDHPNKCKTYRETGATLLLNVFWNDFSPFVGKVEPYYYYSVVLIGTSYKESVPYYESYRRHRTLLTAHGIKIAVLLGGEFNRFHALNFIITLTTALGLLAVATTIVDSFMLYVLPEKDRYQRVKYESTCIDNSSNNNSSSSSSVVVVEEVETPPMQQQQEQQQEHQRCGHNDGALLPSFLEMHEQMNPFLGREEEPPGVVTAAATATATATATASSSFSCSNDGNNNDNNDLEQHHHHDDDPMIASSAGSLQEPLLQQRQT